MDFLGYISHIRACVIEKFTPSQTREETGDVPSGSHCKESENGASSAADRTSRDEIRRENEHLAAELDGVQREYKKLKQVVEQLGREYEESKDFDPLRRYKKMKGMVKRTVLHLRLDPDQQGSTQGIVGLVQGCKEYAQQMESMKRRGEKVGRMTKHDIVADNERMLQQVKEYRRKCSIVRDLILHLERNYESSKRYVMMQRYRLMKNMIKTVIHDKLI